MCEDPPPLFVKDSVSRINQRATAQVPVRRMVQFNTVSNDGTSCIKFNTFSNGQGNSAGNKNENRSYHSNRSNHRRSASKHFNHGVKSNDGLKEAKNFQNGTSDPYNRILPESKYSIDSLLLSRANCNGLPEPSINRDFKSVPNGLNRITSYEPKAHHKCLGFHVIEKHWIQKCIGYDSFVNQYQNSSLKGVELCKACKSMLNSDSSKLK
ncbi:unnamed protein product, partial [Nesidiocoris tenuis]